MFKKKKKTEFDYNEKIKEVKYVRMYQTLKEILAVKTKPDSGENIDYVAACSLMKTKARLVLDFVADLDRSGNEEN